MGGCVFVLFVVGSWWLEGDVAAADARSSACSCLWEVLLVLLLLLIVMVMLMIMMMPEQGEQGSTDALRAAACGRCCWC